MAKALPLDTTISKFTLRGFTTHDASDTTDKIDHYHGHPLYCHVDPAPAGGGVVVTVNEKPPSTFSGASGNVTAVAVEYQASTTVTKQTFTWTIAPGSGLTYNGTGAGTMLVAYLAFSQADLSVAELVIEQKVPDQTRNTVGIVVVGPSITGAAPEGYFVNVPMNKGGSDPTDYTAGGIAWGTAGSVSGPIGNITVP